MDKCWYTFYPVNARKYLLNATKTNPYRHKHSSREIACKLPQRIRGYTEFNGKSSIWNNYTNGLLEDSVRSVIHAPYSHLQPSLCMHLHINLSVVQGSHITCTHTAQWSHPHLHTYSQPSRHSVYSRRKATALAALKTRPFFTYITKHILIWEKHVFRHPLNTTHRPTTALIWQDGYSNTQIKSPYWAPSQYYPADLNSISRSTS